MPLEPQRYDRGRYVEFVDKQLRMGRGAWVEPTGGIVFFDDFLGDTLNTDPWIAVAVASSTAFAISTTDIHGGWIVGATEAAATAATEIAMDVSTSNKGNFRADQITNGGLMVMEARLKLGTITTALAVVGFSDDENEGAALAASLSGTTFTTTATDGAWWVYDTDSTADVWFGHAVDSDVDDTGSGALAIAGAAPVAATAEVLRVEVDAVGFSHFYQNGTYKGSAVAAACGPDVGLLPYIGLASQSTVSLNMSVDYVMAASPRS